MVMPGDRIKMTAELISAIAIEAGMRFAIREGGRTIGAGVVSKSYLNIKQDEFSIKRKN